jgi:hypothetical protein
VRLRVGWSERGKVDAPRGAFAEMGTGRPRRYRGSTGRWHRDPVLVRHSLRRKRRKRRPVSQAASEWSRLRGDDIANLPAFGFIARQARGVKRRSGSSLRPGASQMFRIDGKTTGSLHGVSVPDAWRRHERICHWVCSHRWCCWRQIIASRCRPQNGVGVRVHWCRGMSKTSGRMIV